MTSTRSRQPTRTLIGLAVLLIVACGGQSEPAATSSHSTLPTVGDLVCFDTGAGIEPSVQDMEVMIDSAAGGADSPADAIASFIQDNIGPWQEWQGIWEIQSENSETGSEVLAGNPEVGIARFRVIELDNGWFVESVASCSV